MDSLCFCLKIIQKEAERFNVGVKSSTACQLTAANADNINYDNAHNRCAYLYRCGAINLSFAKDCFSKFLSDYNGMDYLLAKWRFGSNLNFCSISKGPALDYVALLLSHELCRILIPLISNIRIITKHGAWRHTANIMLNIINQGYWKNIAPFSIKNVEVIQGDTFNNCTQKVKFPISDSDIVMMIKTLNLQSDGYDQEKISKNIQEFLDALKPGAVLFCIDTKPSINEITQLLGAFPGKYLLEPTNMNTAINFENVDIYKAHFGCLPVVSGRGCFFVWEKSTFSSASKYELTQFSAPLEHNAGKKCDTATITDSSKALPDKELSNNFNGCNRSNLDVESNGANSFVFGSNEFLLKDNVNDSFQKSNDPLSPDSSVGELLATFDDFKSERLSASLSSLKHQLNSISNNICMQTKQEELKEGTKVAQITELTNKIDSLTVEFSKLLDNSSLKQCASDNCFKSSDKICNNSDPKIDCYSCHYCLPTIPPSRNSQNFGTCCHNFVCHQSSNHDGSNTPNCDETSNNCRSTSSARSHILVENTSTSPQLVIPLNNLPANVISQIISLITQPNHK